MNEEYTIKRSAVFYLSFLILTIITFYPFFSTGFGNADDALNYLVARRGDFGNNAGYLANMSGRFYYYLIYFVMGVPYLADNIFITKLYQLIPILVGMILFARILFRITGSREIGWLSLLIFMTITQISGNTSLFLTYPLYFTFSFDLLLVSLLLLLKYFDTGKRWVLILSSVLFAMGLLFYETYLTYLLVIAILIFDHNRNKEEKILPGLKRAFLQFLPFLLIGIIYLATYFIFRVYHPSKYSGSSFALTGISLSSFFKSLWSLSYTSFPLTVWETSREMFKARSELVQGFYPIVVRVMANARVEWIVKAILVSWMGYQLFTAIQRIKIKYLWAGVGIAILLVFLPQIPLALTPKYPFYVKFGMIGYITTYYSLFGTVLFATIIFGYVSGAVSGFRVINKALAVIFVAGFFICSLLTDFSNYTVAKDVRCANLRFYAISDLVRSEKFRKIPQGSDIFAKDLYLTPSFSARNLTGQSFNWSDYIKAVSGLRYNVYKEDKDYTRLDSVATRPLYYFTMQQAVKSEDVIVVIGKLMHPEPGDTLHQKLTDRALVSYYSPYKIFTLSFKFKGPGPVQPAFFRINHIERTFNAGKEIQLTIYDTDPLVSSTIFTIERSFLDMNSIIISNTVNPVNPVIYL